MKPGRKLGLMLWVPALLTPTFFMLTELTFTWSQPWASASGLDLYTWWLVDIYPNWTIRYRVTYQLARFNLRTGSYAPALEHGELLAEEASRILELLKMGKWRELAELYEPVWSEGDWSSPGYVRQRVLRAISAYLMSMGAAPMYYTSAFTRPRASASEHTWRAHMEVEEVKGIYVDRSYLERHVRFNEASVSSENASFTLDCSFYIYASPYFPYMRRYVEGAPGSMGVSSQAEATVFSLWLLHPDGRASPIEGPIHHLELRLHGGLKLVEYRLSWIYPWSFRMLPSQPTGEPDEGELATQQECWLLFSPSYIKPEEPTRLELSVWRAEATGWSLTIDPRGRGWGVVLATVGAWGRVYASPNAVEVAIRFPWAPGWLEPLNILNEEWALGFKAIAGAGDTEALRLLKETLKLAENATSRVLLGGPLRNPGSAQLLEKTRRLCTEIIEYRLDEREVELILPLWDTSFRTDFRRRGHLHRDYCLIALTGEYTCPHAMTDRLPSQAEVLLLAYTLGFQSCYRRTLLIWGNTRYGTLAGVFWLSQRPWRHISFPASIIVLEWTDLNENSIPDEADRYRVVYPSIMCELEAGRWASSLLREGG